LHTAFIFPSSAFLLLALYLRFLLLLSLLLFGPRSLLIQLVLLGIAFPIFPLALFDPLLLTETLLRGDYRVAVKPNGNSSRGDPNPDEHAECEPDGHPTRKIDCAHGVTKPM
jgi:hypothetical protein